MKKLLAIILVLAILGGGYYYFYSAAPKAPVENTGAKKAVLASSSPVIDPVSSYDGDSIWYGNPNGRMMRYDIVSGQETEHPLPQVLGQSYTKIYWPPQGNDFISLGLSDNKPVHSYYNFETKTYTVLPENVLSLDWLNDGKRVVMIWKNTAGKAQLVTSNADATGYKVIRDLPWTDLVPKASPTNNTALLVRPFPQEEVNKIYLFDLEKGDYTEVVKEGKNTAVMWSPNGDSFVYAQLVNNQSQLFWYDLLNQTGKSLNMPGSIDKVIYSLDGNSLHLVKPAADGDEIIEYTISSGQQKSLYKLPAGQKAKYPLIVDNIVHFVGATDNFLYAVE